jgi:hypothetical protein
MPIAEIQVFGHGLVKRLPFQLRQLYQPILKSSSLSAYFKLLSP